MQKEVIQKLDKRKPDEIPLSLLEGLHELVRKSDQTELLRSLFETCFPNWLNDLKDDINRKKQKDKAFAESLHHDAIIALLSSAVKNDAENVRLLMEKNLHEVVAEIFSKSNRDHPRYLYLMDCMNYVAQGNEPAASHFVNKNVHKELLQEIKTTFYNYKKHNDIVSANG